MNLINHVTVIGWNAMWPLKLVIMETMRFSSIKLHKNYKEWPVFSKCGELDTHCSTLLTGICITIFGRFIWNKDENI